MIIYNTSKLNTGMGVYALNLSRYLNLGLVNDFLSDKHYYLDYIKKSISKIKIYNPVLNSSVFYRYIGDKNIFVLHDFFYRDYAEYMDLMGRLTFEYALFNAKRIADLFVCVSKYTYNRASVEINKNRLETIYPFVNWDFNYQGEKVKDRLILLMDNTNYKNKRAEYYQKFYEHIFRNYYFDKIRVNKLGYPLRLYYLDYRSKNYQNIPENEVIKIYKESNVFVSFSENEGFGYPLSQAILSGNSVVVSDNQTYREILGNDYRYFIKDINNFDDIYYLIIQAFDDNEMRKSIYNKVSMMLNPETLRKEWEYVLDKIGVKL